MKLTKERGNIIFDHKGVKNAFLVYKSIFNNNNKSFSINLFKDGSFGSPIIEQDFIIDFTANDKYFAYTTDGNFSVLDLSTSQEVFTYDIDGNLTADTPIFINENTVLFRYSMDDILIANIEQGVAESIITNKKNMVSKPIYQNDILSFAIETFDLNSIEDSSNTIFVEYNLKK